MPVYREALEVVRTTGEIEAGDYGSSKFNTLDHNSHRSDTGEHIPWRDGTPPGLGDVCLKYGLFRDGAPLVADPPQEAGGTE